MLEPGVALSALPVRLRGRKELGKPLLQPGETGTEERAQELWISFLKNDV